MKSYKKLSILFILAAGLLSCGNQTSTFVPQNIKHAHINWVPYTKNVFKNNISKNYIIVYVTSPYCPPCKFMQKTTFQSERVAPLINGLFLPVKVNISRADNSEIAQVILRKENKIPQMLFYIRNNSTQSGHNSKPGKTNHVIGFEYDKLGINTKNFTYVGKVVGMLNKFQMAEVISKVRMLRAAKGVLPEVAINPTLINEGKAEDGYSYIFNLQKTK